ncbi:hypothetical protein Tco_1185360 [Tanacetum coccineum]
MRSKQSRVINDLRSFNKLHNWYQSLVALDLGSIRFCRKAKDGVEGCKVENYSLTLIGGYVKLSCIDSVRIPLEEIEILRVHGERTQGVVRRTLLNEGDEPKCYLVGDVYMDIAIYVSKFWTCLRGEGCNVKDFWLAATALERLGDKVVLIKEKLKAARDRQKSYADNGRKPLEFEVGDRVLLKVSPWKGVIHFGNRGKLAPRYVGPFEILERIGPVAYRLRLPEELSGVHDTYYVSNLKKCLADAYLHVPLNEIKIDKTLRFVEEPVEIMDREIKKLKRSKISLVKVRWNSKRGPEFTWERED